MTVVQWKNFATLPQRAASLLAGIALLLLGFRGAIVANAFDLDRELDLVADDILETLHVEIKAIELRVRREAGLALERVRIVAGAIELEVDVDGLRHAVQDQVAVDRARGLVLRRHARARVARGREAARIEELARLDRVVPFRIAHV